LLKAGNFGVDGGDKVGYAHVFQYTRSQYYTGGMEHFLTWFLSALGGAFVGSFVAGYLRKKGENLATHEDLDKLIVQMKATTEATKAIEARISDEVWNKQRQWELKREIIIQLIRSLSATENALMELYSIHAATLPNIQELIAVRLQERLSKTDLWNAANLELDNARVIAALVAGKDLSKAMFGATYAIRLAGKSILIGDTGKFDKHQVIISKLQHGVLVAAQKELGLEIADFLDTYEPKGNSEIEEH
jgi:hypothetical protein